MEFHTELKNTILDTDEYRYCEIYKIVNLVNQKVYIGKAVSHILPKTPFQFLTFQFHFHCNKVGRRTTRLTPDSSNEKIVCAELKKKETTTTGDEKFRASNKIE